MNKYVYDKSKLPKPILSGGDEYINLYYKAWEMLFKNIDYIDKEGWKPQLTCMPGVGIVWQWDSCFMVFITNYSNNTVSALNNLDNLYRLRRKEDGYMSMAYDIETEKEAYGNRINPPLMAWAEWEAYLISGDSSRFKIVLPALEGMYSYIENYRKRIPGLYWFEDPGSSGMDNSPRGGYKSYDLKGSDLCHIDLACQQALSAECISNIYTVLGDAEKADFYAKEHQRICELINQYHWSSKAGYYYDFFSRSSTETKMKLINIKTAAAFWTLLCGAAEGEKASRVLEHLFNPREFYTHIPFASLSKDDLNYDETGGYWLGGVWAPTNYVAIRGLVRLEKRKEAKEAATKYLDGMCRTYQKPQYQSIWEAYAPERDVPATTEDGRSVRKDFVGWSALAPITMLIENILGFTFNAKSNTIYFDIPSVDESGIENMLFNGGYISVVCKKTEVGYEIEVSAEKEVTLVLCHDTQEIYKQKIIPGKHIIYV